MIGLSDSAVSQHKIHWPKSIQLPAEIAVAVAFGVAGAARSSLLGQAGSSPRLVSFASLFRLI